MSNRSRPPTRITSGTFDAAQQIAQLQTANLSLLRQLARAKARRDELVQAVYDGAETAASALTIPPVRAPKPDTRKHTAEAAIVILSDWQLAKRTASYNSAVCATRIEQYADKVEQLTAIQRADHPVRECHIYLLGDLVEGELIFGNQAHLIDASLFDQVMVTGRRILVNFVRRMLATFETVHVAGVVGNHGDLGGGPFRKAYHPESNADAMLYETSRLILKGDEGDAREPRLTWASNRVSGERLWYAVHTVGDKAWLLFHGDQVPTSIVGGPVWERRILGWRAGAIKEQFHYACSGHYHRPGRHLYGTIEHWASGSTESDNTHAAERYGSMGLPTQWLLFQHLQRGISAEYLVRLA